MPGGVRYRGEVQMVVRLRSAERSAPRRVPADERSVTAPGAGRAPRCRDGGVTHVDHRCPIAVGGRAACQASRASRSFMPVVSAVRRARSAPNPPITAVSRNRGHRRHDLQRLVDRGVTTLAPDRAVRHRHSYVEALVIPEAVHLKATH